MNQPARPLSYEASVIPINIDDEQKREDMIQLLFEIVKESLLLDEQKNEYGSD